MSIASTELIKIGDTDLTRFITVPDYKVNKVPVSKTWTDANQVSHKRILRYRIEGDFKVKFFNVDDFENFIRLIEENTNSDGYVRATVYVNNKLISTEGDFFISYEIEDFIPFIGTKDYDGFDIKIVER